MKLQDKKTGGYASFSDPNTLFAFDTSQILIGLVAIYQKTKKIKYKTAAIKGGDFLLMMQEQMWFDFDYLRRQIHNQNRN